VPGKGVSRHICSTSLVYHFVPQACQFGEHLQLPRGLQTLIVEVNHATVIRKDNKLDMLEVAVPLIHDYQNGKYSLS
jgi:hypothetical protein